MSKLSSELSRNFHKPAGKSISRRLFSSRILSLSSRFVFAQFVCLNVQGGPKMAPFLYALTLPNINRF